MPSHVKGKSKITQGQISKPPAYNLLKHHAAEHPDNPYIAVVGVWNASKERYDYNSLPLAFPDSMRKAAEGQVAYYRYKLSDSTKSVRNMAALIPSISGAKYMMYKWLEVKNKKWVKSARATESIKTKSSIDIMAKGPGGLNCKDVILPDGTWYFYDCEELVVTPEPGEVQEPVDEIVLSDDEDEFGNNWPEGSDECQDPLYNCGDDLPGGGSGLEDEEGESELCETSAEEIGDAFPDAPKSTVNDLAKYVNEHAADFGIDTEAEMQHFLAQAGHESSDWKGDEFSAFEENLNYRVQRLGKEDYWELYFNTVENPTADPNKANPFDYAEYSGSKYVDHEKFANYVYNDANRLPGYKLGNTAPGDGYKYRGRGIFQLTGKDNYENFNDFYQNNYDSTVDFVNDPSSIASNTEIAVISALWFFNKNVLGNDGELEENASVESITEKINGGDKGIDHRKQLFNVTKTHINCL